MLRVQTVADRDGVAIADVTCRHAHKQGAAEESPGHALVLVRQGCFARSADGVRSLLDSTTAFCTNPAEEQRYDHPRMAGDDCTALMLDAGMVASVWGGELMLPKGSLPTTPAIDLEHRLLLAATRQACDPHEPVERAVALIALALEQSDARPVASGRPATGAARRALVDGVRAALAEDPDRSLTDLARMVSVSAHHLSRVFRAATGHTVARHRMRVRAHGAMERLMAGERDLARLAADVGFADHSHLCRVLRQETGSTPAALRRLLSPA
jgi:AraC-like DNA-binding protein